MATLEQNVRQVNADFQAIKAKIVENGVEVADGTKTAEYAQKIDEVYEKGRQDEHDAFWSAYQENGNRADYTEAFTCFGWTDVSFKPKYDIRPTSGCDYMFSKSKITDLASILNTQGVTLDLSKSTSVEGVFRKCRQLTHIPLVSVENAKSTTYLFNQCTSLVTIDCLRLKSDGTNTFNATFTECYSLVNLKIEGTIGQNGFDVSACSKLSRDSYFSIFNALSDTTSGLTITLHSYKALYDAILSLDETDELLLSKRNWTISFMYDDMP
jgi:hypothetical protein